MVFVVLVVVWFVVVFVGFELDIGLCDVLNFLLMLVRLILFVLFGVVKVMGFWFVLAGVLLVIRLDCGMGLIWLVEFGVLNWLLLKIVIIRMIKVNNFVVFNLVKMGV